jgi:ECF sigma factor
MAARCFISAKIESEPFQRGNDFECKRIRKGDREAESKLIPLVYKELRRLAGFYLSGERPDHTLHRLLWYAKLLHLTQLKEIDWQSSSHFFAISSQMMRRILIDHARAQLSEKRGSRVKGDTLRRITGHFSGKSRTASRSRKRSDQTGSV